MKRKYMLFSLLGVLMVKFGFVQQKTINNIACLVCISICYILCEAIDFGDINENPNRPTVAVASQLLTEAQKAIGNSVVTSVKGILFIQQLTEG